MLRDSSFACQFVNSLVVKKLLLRDASLLVNSVNAVRSGDSLTELASNTSDHEHAAYGKELEKHKVAEM